MLQWFSGPDPSWKTRAGNRDPFPALGQFPHVTSPRGDHWVRGPADTTSRVGTCCACPALCTAPPPILAPAAPPHCSIIDQRGAAFADADDMKEDNMIYVESHICGVRVEMMVDTGAQQSVMTEPMVRRLGLINYVDRSEQGVALGVGTAKILGMLHHLPVRLGRADFSIDFAVLGIRDNFVMLGMDQLQRFRCVLDLDKRIIRWGGQAGGLEVPFLPQRPLQPKIVLVEIPCVLM